jgi:hypothetical protein
LVRKANILPSPSDVGSDGGLSCEECPKKMEQCPSTTAQKIPVILDVMILYNLADYAKLINGNNRNRELLILPTRLNLSCRKCQGLISQSI